VSEPPRGRQAGNATTHDHDVSPLDIAHGTSMRAASTPW
jgi:hypothetical protein